MRRFTLTATVLLPLVAPEMAGAQTASRPVGGAASAPDDQATPAAEPASAEGAAVRTGLPGHIVFGGKFDTKAAVDVLKQSRGTSSYVSAYADAQLSGYFHYDTWLSFNSTAKLERTRNTNLASYYVDRTQAFRSEGLTLRQLYATVRPSDAVALYGGKIHPRFGSGWEDVPGVFYSYATDYEQDERIGFGVELKLPAWTGQTVLSAEAFFLDTSFLSNSLISRVDQRDDTGARPSRFRRFQGGPSNTGRPESVTIALRGSQVPGLPELGYQLSFTREAAGQPGERAETGVSASAKYALNLTRRLSATPFLEYAHFDNFAVQPGLRRDYLVGGIAFAYGKWELDTAGGYRRSRGSASNVDTQANVTLTYELMEGFRAGGGINFVHSGNKDSVALSPALTYARSF